jgi:hypothetical protein
MRRILVASILIGNLAFSSFAQDKSLKRIDRYTIGVDHLRNNEKLDSVIYTARSYCGGVAIGFYECDSQFVLIHHAYGIEHTYGFQNVYFRDGKLVKITASKYQPDQQKYQEMHDSLFADDGEPLVPLAYLDTSWVIYFSDDTLMTTYSENQVISTEVDTVAMNFLYNCSLIMVRELRREDYIWGPIPGKD